MLNTVSPVKHPDPQQLARFETFARMDSATIHLLADQLEVQTASKGQQLLAMGETDPTLLYLLSGKLLLEAGDGARKLIRAEDDSARRPIARLRPSRYRIISASLVEYLLVPDTLLETNHQASPGTDANGIALYEVNEFENEDQQTAEDRLAYRLYEDLNNNQLLLPSLPDVAIRVGQAIDHELADARRVARVIENDPVIAAKLIKVANSARYAGLHTVGTLTEAVTRIGLGATHSLVITFALRELFRCHAPLLYESMRDLWERARRVAVIAQVLARLCGGLDPDGALLGGLVHNIGAVAAISYASDFPELHKDPAALAGAVERIRGPLSALILSHWDFPPELVESLAEDPALRNHEGRYDLGDVVSVARLEADRHQDDDPPISPAYDKLGLDREQIAHALDEADTELEEMLSLLN